MNYPDQLKTFKNHLIEIHGLSEEEASAVTAFKSGFGYRILNAKIRQGKLTPEDLVFCKDLNAGILKIPSTSSQTITRNLDFVNFQLKKVTNFFLNNLNKQIRFPDFQSCTIREDFTADSKNSNKNCSLIISTMPDSKGADLHKIWDKIALNEPEQEVMMPWNSCYEIKKVIKGKHLKVYLQELPYVEDAILVPDF